MAVWQFQFELVPVQGILRIQGEPVCALPQFAAMDPGAEYDEDQEYPNYWEGVDMAPVHKAIEQLLPKGAPWSDDATMYGDSKTDDIQVWDDTVGVRLDCRKFRVELLEAVLNVAKDFGCVLALKEGGRVIAPEMPLVLGALRESSAVRFIRDPAGYLEGCSRIFDQPG